VAGENTPAAANGKPAPVMVQFQFSVGRVSSRAVVAML